MVHFALVIHNWAPPRYTRREILIDTRLLLSSFFSRKKKCRQSKIPIWAEKRLSESKKKKTSLRIFILPPLCVIGSFSGVWRAVSLVGGKLYLKNVKKSKKEKEKKRVLKSGSRGGLIASTGLTSKRMEVEVSRLYFTTVTCGGIIENAFGSWKVFGHAWTSLQNRLNPFAWKKAELFAQQTNLPAHRELRMNVALWIHPESTYFCTRPFRSDKGRIRKRKPSYSQTEEMCAISLPNPRRGYWDRNPRRNKWERKE